MGIAKTTLEYVSLSTGNWTAALGPDDSDAVVMISVQQNINSAARAEILLSNRSPNPTSTVASEAKGLLTDVFTDFQRIRLIHQEKGIPIFSGRIYRIRDKYDMQYGQVIRLVAFDSFKEILQYPIDDAAESLEKIDTTSSDTGGYDLRKRSQLIKYILAETGLKDTNLLTTDANHFEDSWSTGSLGDKSLDVTKLDRYVGGVIGDLSIVDPVKDQGGTHIGESGYDYRVEPRLVSSAVTSKPIESLHYFMRGTRPGKGGAYGASAAPVLTNTATDSLTIEYAPSAVDSGLTQTMMSQYEFDKPKEELYTSIVCHYTDEFREYDDSGNEETAGQIEGVVTFELLKGSALSGTFTWAGRALDATKIGATTATITEWLTHDGNNVARVQWQNSDGFLLLISHINETNFPTANTNVTLTGATSGATFIFNASTGRMKTRYGLNRPHRIQRNFSSDLGMIRDEIVSRLVGRLDLVILRSRFQTLSYPIVYHDLVDTATPPASTASRSANTITWTGAVLAQTRGVRVGHIAAEIGSSGEYVRYAYISAVNSNTSITYGASATDTSDETALDVSNTIRLIIPLRPGDVIKVKNATSGIDTNQVILSMGYDETPGMFATKFEAIGSNNKFSNIYGEGEDIRAAVAAAMPKKFPADKSLGEASLFFDGFINRGSNPSDSNNYRKIHWTTSASATSGAAGTLTFSDGNRYTIACANSAILTTAEHTIFFRPTKARATVNKSDTTFQVVLTTSYNMDNDDILVGTCYAVDDKPNAKAVLTLRGDFMSRDLFALGQNGSINEALLSKSAQVYNSALEIIPIATNHSDYASNGHLHIVWAAAAITFADGDSWTIVAGGNDGSSPYYSVTTNGTSYANINVLAAGSVYYAYIDTSEASSGGNLNLRVTTNYSHISTHTDGTFSSAKVLLAQIVTPSSSTAGYKVPRIFPFGNRTLTINAASIAAESITATHITASAITADKIMAGGLPGSVLNIDSGTTFSTGYNPTEKAKTTSAASAPSSPNTGDLWIDTDDSNKLYRWSGSAWVPFDLGLARATADTATTNAGTALDTANTKTTTFRAASAPYALKIGDVWIDTDDQKIYTASGTGTGNWNLRDDAGAISSATTNISGGRISTQAIVLKSGGAGNPNNTNSIFVDDDSTGNTGTRVLLHNTGIFGYNGSTTQFTIDATDGKAKFGGLTNAILSAEGIQLGHATFSSAPFSVTPAGLLTATNAVITGTITATSGAFTGDMTAGAGVLINASGLHIKQSGSTKFLKFENSSGAEQSAIYVADPVTLWYTPYATNPTENGKEIIIGSEPDNQTNTSTPVTKAITFQADYIGFHPDGQPLGEGPIYYRFPDDNPASGEVLAHSGTTVSQTIGGSSRTVYDLEWAAAPTSVGGLASGSAAAPTINFSVDTDTGIYYYTASTYYGMGFAVDGAVKALLWTNGTTPYLSMFSHIEFNGYSAIELHNLTFNSSSSVLNLNGGSMTNVDDLTMSGNLYNTATVRFSNLATGNETYDVRMGGSGYLYKYSSSKRFKENIIDLDLDSSKIYSLSPHTFKWKDRVEDETSIVGQTDFGYIAEEVHELLPQLVGYDNFEDGDNLPASVHYNQITVLLVEELKKLKARIEVLEGS